MGLVRHSVPENGQKALVLEDIYMSILDGDGCVLPRFGFLEVETEHQLVELA